MALTKKTVKDIDVAGKRVLVRVDYNVPLSGGQVGDELRIRASLETLNYLLDHGAALVLISHLGRPGGRADMAFSLRPVAARLAELLQKPVEFLPDCVGSEVRNYVESMQPGQIVLLENLRFHPEEEENEASFATSLAKHGQVFVQDGFGVVHRGHASTTGIPNYLPSVAGLLVEKEVNFITDATDNPKRPLVAVVGGAKVSDKIEVLEKLMASADTLIIGGAMANTFLAAQGVNVGQSIYEPDQVETAKSILAGAQIPLILPRDAVVAEAASATSEASQVELNEVGDNDMILDVGSASVAAYREAIKDAGTVLWNGPIGYSEFEQFASASKQLAQMIIDSQATSIIGGGDTAAFVDAHGWHDKFTWVSTGGGASLDLIAGKPLPGIEALLDA